MALLNCSVQDLLLLGFQERARGRRLSTEELDAFAETVPLLLKRYDCAGKCVYISKGSERFTGKPTSWFIGRHIDDYVGYPPEFIKIIKDSIKQILITHQPSKCETTLDKPSGTKRRAHYQCPEFDDQGAIVSILSVSADITEQYNIYTKLELTLREQTQFLTLMAHELRNPLAAVLHGVEALDRNPPTIVAESVRSLMRQEITHITRLVTDLLDSARLETGSLQYEFRPHAVNECIQLACHITEHARSCAKQVLQCRLATEAVTVSADSMRLTQAIANILHNASKFSPPSSTIILTARVEEDQVLIDVTDQGPGMAPASYTSIFERYATGFATQPGREPGLGLGLYLAREIFRRHHGDIQLVSSGENGSCFRLILPIHHEAVANDDCNLDTAPRRYHSQPLSILAVDDNLAALQLLKTLLELEGHTVHTASNAADGEALFHAHKPRVVLLDVGLPALDGRQLAQRLRSHPDGKTTAIIALTGWGTDKDVELSLHAGCCAHLTKPVNFDQLSQAIHNAVQETPRLSPS